MTEPGAQETNTLPKLPDFKLPPVGTHVHVERSSGELQLGWTLIGENPVDRRIEVRRFLPGQEEKPFQHRIAEIKHLSRGDFIRTNPIPGIDDVNNFEQLKEAIGRVSFVQGSQATYRSKDLVRLVEDVKSGKKQIDELTRTGGLREKVEILLGKK